MAQITKKEKKDGSSSYFVRVLVGVDSSGKKIVKSKSFSPEKGLTPTQEQKALDAFVKRFEVEASLEWEKNRDNPERQQEEAIKHSKLTLLEFIDTVFLPLYVNDGNKSQITIDFYNNEIKRIRQFFGTVQLRYCDSIKIQEYFKFLRTEYKTPRGTELSANSLKHCYKTLCTIFKFALTNDYILKNPMDKVPAPKVPKKKVDAMTQEEAKQFVGALEGTELEFRTKVYLMLTSGLRRGEVCGLQWSDIDFKRGLLSINRAMVKSEGNSCIESTPKTENSIRTIPLTRTALEMLLALKTTNKGIWVFKNRFPNTLTQQVKKFTKQIGLPDYSPHDLRHTCATLLLQGGTDIKSVATILGHSDASTTLEYYCGYDIRQMAKAVSAFDTMLA